ncbi:hypothetical protein [Desulfocurvus sp. DL9XJH121]
MKKYVMLAAVCAVLALALPALAMEGMEKGGSAAGGTFKQAVDVDGVHAEFQIMELAAMNMQDPEGHTHHVMAGFTKDGQKLVDLAGKVKLIAPSGKEQTAGLKNYGGGAFAANFTIDEPGKWGVICMFKENGATHVARLWYHFGG